MEGIDSSAELQTIQMAEAVFSQQDFYLLFQRDHLLQGGPFRKNLPKAVFQRHGYLTSRALRFHRLSPEISKGEYQRAQHQQNHRCESYFGIFLKQGFTAIDQVVVVAPELPAQFAEYSSRRLIRLIGIRVQFSEHFLSLYFLKFSSP